MDDRDTRACFGDYVHIYDIEQAVQDGATVPIYYESRLAKLEQKEADVTLLDSEVDELTEDEEGGRRQGSQAAPLGRAGAAGGCANPHSERGDRPSSRTSRTGSPQWMARRW
jgi:hypothetical protein